MAFEKTKTLYCATVTSRYEVPIVEIMDSVLPDGYSVMEIKECSKEYDRVIQTPTIKIFGNISEDGFSFDTQSISSEEEFLKLADFLSDGDHASVIIR